MLKFFPTTILTNNKKGATKKVNMAIATLTTKSHPFYVLHMRMTEVYSPIKPIKDSPIAEFLI